MTGNQSRPSMETEKPSFVTIFFKDYRTHKTSMTIVFHFDLSCKRPCLFFSGFVENVGEMASAAVLTVEMSRHEDTGAAILVGALTSQASDLAVLIDLVVLEDRKLDLLSLVLDLLGGGEGLLLALLATSSQAEDEMEGRLLLDVVVGQSATILELLASEDQTLLVGRDALFVLDFGFDIFDGIARLDLKSDGLPRESLNKNLHLEIFEERVYMKFFF